MSNYDLLLQTIETLRTSQGFYSRLARDLEQMSDDGREQLKNDVNGLRQWSGVVDCVLWLEG